MSFWRSVLAAVAMDYRDDYTIVTGSAGYIKLYKNGERIQPRNATLRFKAHFKEPQDEPS